jgi:hypothetical protein
MIQAAVQSKVTQDGLSPGHTTLPKAQLRVNIRSAANING